MRKRHWSLFVLLFFLVLSFAVPVFAAGNDYVFDEADILTADEEQILAETAKNISARYGCGVYIVTLRDYSDFGSSVRNAAENYFLAHDFGLGNDGSGVMLLLSMAERDFSLIAHGSLGNGAFTDYGKEILSEEFLDDFRYDDWLGGFTDYLSGSDDLLYAAAQGEPINVGQKSDSTVLTLVMILLIPAVIAGIACGIMAASMKTARRKTNADDYLQGIRITNRHDRFLTRTVVRQKIESSSSSGGTSVNSRGFSGRSGKF